MSVAASTVTAGGTAPQTTTKAKDPLQYLLTPSDFRQKVLRPLIVETRKLVNAAKEVGSARVEASTAIGGPETAKQANKQLQELMAKHLSRLSGLAHYHRKMYSINSAKAQRVLNGETSRRSNRPARALANYDTSFLNFLREAADSHENLKFFKSFAVFDKNSPLQGLCTSLMVSQFLLCYSAVHQRFNPENRQFIQPNEQMLRHLGPEIKETLKKQAEKIPELSSRYQGQLRFPFVQTLISRYRRPPTTDEDRERLRNLSNDVQVISTLNRENETLTTVRAKIWQELQQTLVPRPKVNVAKLNKAKTTARRAKKLANSLAAVAAVPVAA